MTRPVLVVDHAFAALRPLLRSYGAHGYDRRKRSFLPIDVQLLYFEFAIIAPQRVAPSDQTQAFYRI